MLCSYQEVVVFEEAFFMEWGKCLIVGTNFFRDPHGNVINIEFEKSLLRKRMFVGCSQLRSFYNLHEEVPYIVCMLFCGDRYFQVRLFFLSWREIKYPMNANVDLANGPVFSSKFFSSFSIVLVSSRPVIEMDDAFERFRAKHLDFGLKVHVIDPKMKKFAFRLLEKEDDRHFLYGAVKEMFDYYELSARVNLNLNYVGENVFLFRMFSREGVEFNYEPVLGTSLLNVREPIDDIVADSDGDGMSMLKVLSDFDTQASSLYLTSNFVKALSKGRKKFLLVTWDGGYGPCKARWSGRGCECYLSSGWKRFCSAYGLVGGDTIKLEVAKRKNYIISVKKL